MVTLSAHRTSGAPVAAIPLVRRKVGFWSIAEIPGAYWPFRSFPVAADARPDELADLLGSSEARRELGGIWRLGPIQADDPAARLLTEAARQSGWTLLPRRIGTAYRIDLAAVAAAGPWPSSKTLRKNRWLQRRLCPQGEPEYLSVSGSDWAPEIFDRLARIESESWVGRSADARDTKFLHPPNRRLWEEAIADPRLASLLSCSILQVGDRPAAFTLMLRSGDRLHILANSYSESFAEGSPGRLLLYHDIAGALAQGISLIDWGTGDPGYKREMGAEAGPELVDLLMVRSRLAATFARSLWTMRTP